MLGILGQKMLKTPLLHPEILEALAGAGHGSTVLIADSNYPASTTAGPNARIVYLNLAPGKLNAVEVAEALLASIPAEQLGVMATADGSRPPIWDAFQALSPQTPLVQIERFAFYEEVGKPSLCLLVETGETAIYANLLITVGVVQP